MSVATVQTALAHPVNGSKFLLYLCQRALLHALTNRKTISLTQPGRGIRKIIDLYHDLPVLVDKARIHVGRNMMDPEEIAEIDQTDFVGMTEDEIEEEQKE